MATVVVNEGSAAVALVDAVVMVEGGVMLIDGVRADVVVACDGCSAVMVAAAVVGTGSEFVGAEVWTELGSACNVVAASSSICSSRRLPLPSSTSSSSRSCSSFASAATVVNSAASVVVAIVVVAIVVVETVVVATVVATAPVKVDPHVLHMLGHNILAAALSVGCEQNATVAVKQLAASTHAVRAVRVVAALVGAVVVGSSVVDVVMLGCTCSVVDVVGVETVLVLVLMLVLVLFELPVLVGVDLELVLAAAAVVVGTVFSVNIAVDPSEVNECGAGVLVEDKAHSPQSAGQKSKARSRTAIAEVVQNEPLPTQAEWSCTVHTGRRRRKSWKRKREGK